MSSTIATLLAACAGFPYKKRLWAELMSVRGVIPAITVMVGSGATKIS